METQFGLAHVWNQGDWVTRTVALILLAMSVFQLAEALREGRDSEQN